MAWELSCLRSKDGSNSTSLNNFLEVYIHKTCPDKFFCIDFLNFYKHPPITKSIFQWIKMIKLNLIYQVCYSLQIKCQLQEATKPYNSLCFRQLSLSNFVKVGLEDDDANSYF